MIRVLHDIFKADLWPLYKEHVLAQTYNNFLFFKNPEMNVKMELEKEIGRIEILKNFYRQLNDTDIHYESSNLALLIVDGVSRVKFWRHKYTNTVCVPKLDLEMQGLLSLYDIDGQFEMNWDCYADIKVKENQIIIIPSTYFFSLVNENGYVEGISY